MRVQTKVAQLKIGIACVPTYECIAKLLAKCDLVFENCATGQVSNVDIMVEVLQNFFLFLIS